MLNSHFVYSAPDTSKEKEEGFSHEYVSVDSKYVVEKGADLDSLQALQYEGVDTLYKAIQRNVKNMPDSPILGTLNQEKNDYDWMSFK